VEPQFAGHIPSITELLCNWPDAIKVIYSLNLRHDINFDPDLHFGPNLDGESKVQETTTYCDASTGIFGRASIAK
jgi:hypothetical protein